jgi:hypothetical protein
MYHHSTLKQVRGIAAAPKTQRLCFQTFCRRGRFRLAVAGGSRRRLVARGTAPVGRTGPSSRSTTALIWPSAVRVRPRVRVSRFGHGSIFVQLVENPQLHSGSTFLNATQAAPMRPVTRLPQAEAPPPIGVRHSLLGRGRRRCGGAGHFFAGRGIGPSGWCG